MEILPRILTVTLLFAFVGCTSASKNVQTLAPSEWDDVFITRDILENVRLGDSLERVSENVGKPNDFVSSRLSENGKSIAVYRYKDVIARPNRHAGEYLVGLTKKMGVDAALQVHDTLMTLHPSYLITFTDNIVTGINKE